MCIRDRGKVVLSNRNGRKVLLNDVAEIRDTLEKATMDERVNGQLGVRVIIQKQSGANTVDIVHEVQRRLPAIAASLPGDVDIELIYEGSQEITDAIGSLSETIMYAFIFVVLVVMIFLGRWRATFIICLTIPVSLICSFIYLYAVGSTLNIISLSSMESRRRTSRSVSSSCVPQCFILIYNLSFAVVMLGCAADTAAQSP